MKTLILDNEAVDALRDPRHPHHRTALAYYEANRTVRRSDKDRRTIVPSAVRVEAGWDRSAPTAAVINRLAIEDAVLDRAAADLAAVLVTTHRVSVANAHIGATIGAAPGQQVSVLTSDPKDIATVAGARPVTIVSL